MINWNVGVSGYLFSSDIMATVERYGNEVAESVMEKARKICRDLGGDVSLPFLPF